MPVGLFASEGTALLTLIKAVDQTADHIMITDTEGTILYINPAFLKTTGFEREEVLGQNPKILKSGRHNRDYYHRLWQTILNGQVFSSTIINRKKNGELYYADQSITPIYNERGDITNFVSVWKDITERIVVTEELNRIKEKLEFEKIKLEQVLNVEEKLNTIFHLDRLVDFIVENTAKVLEAERCSLMFVDEFSGELCVKGYVGPNHEQVMKARLRIGDPIAGVVAEEGQAVLVTDIEKDKRFFRANRPTCKTKSFVSTPIKLGQSLIGVLNAADKIGTNSIFNELDLKILSMISRQVAVAIENAKLYRELKFLTITDPITGLYNYRYFIKTLDQEMMRVKRYSAPLCLIMIDVDNFKSYNDTFGHLEGDHVLRSVAHVLTTNLREVDIACRYAGDEFVLILPETDLKEAKIVAEKIRMKAQELDLKQKVTLSLGVAKFKEGMGRHDFILQADTFLYQAKKEGKNKIYSA